MVHAWAVLQANGCDACEHDYAPVGDREYTATLLRRSYRQDGKVKKETLANLSHLPGSDRRDPAVLAGETLVNAHDAFEIERSLPAGHVTRRWRWPAGLSSRSCWTVHLPGSGICACDDPRPGDLPGSKLGRSAPSASRRSPVNWCGERG